MPNNMTLIELLGKDLSSTERMAYNANAVGKRISEVTISGNVIKGYGAFSFLMEKSYFEQPQRSADGSMPDIQDLPTFLTPHLKIDFSLLFIDDYRTIMRLIREKNEHVVTCYDIVEDKQVTHRMYFATEQMPKIYALARALQGQTDNAVELLGVQDYTVELIGTNNSVETVTITYHVNPPASNLWSGESSVTRTYYKNLDAYIGNNAIVKGTNNVEYNIPSLTFNNEYEFQYWATNSNGSGFKYTNGETYKLYEHRDLYAIWKESAE